MTHGTGLELRHSKQGTDEQDMQQWGIPIERDKDQATRDFSRVNPLKVALLQVKE